MHQVISNPAGKSDLNWAVKTQWKGAREYEIVDDWEEPGWIIVEEEAPFAVLEQFIIRPKRLFGEGGTRMEGGDRGREGRHKSIYIASKKSR
eukprot:410115-Rhodomonas_salina.2